MSYMKLIKLLYFADREALLTLGRPITFDRFFSMRHGPVLSRTYDLIAAEPDPDDPTYWHEYISVPDRYYDVTLLQDAPNSQLSRAEETVLDRVFDRVGHLSRWQIRDLSHKLPEWKDPDKTSQPINLREVLAVGGISDEDAEAIEDAIAAEDMLHQLSAD
jgi:uncharacterized phage-associated protein